LKRKYSIIIVPPENNKKPHQIDFTITTKKILIACGIVLAASVALLTVGNFSQADYIKRVQVKIAYNEALEKEIKAKEMEIERLNNITASINADLQTIADYEAQINDMLDIAPEGGVPSRGEPESESEAEPSAQTVVNNIEQAAVQVAQHASSLEDIYSASLTYKEALRHIPSIYPVSGQLSSNYGYRRNPFGGSSSEFHDGVDFSCAYGAVVRATAAGSVIASEYESGWGYRVIIDHGNGIQTFYAHNSRLAVHVGQIVDKGDTIAYAGNSGRSTGTHCHFGASVNGNSVNPLSLMK
jgi:murein DD-endopeptidase MepM/ murein hydrolase activator NlpD